MLSGSPDPLAAAAGVSDFDEFGDINVLDELSAGDVLKWDNLLAQPYEVIFTKLKLDKKKREFEKKYEQLQRDQAEARSARKTKYGR